MVVSARLPADVLPELVPVIVADTSSSYEWREELEKELEKAQVIILTYKVGDAKSLKRCGTYWLPELRHTKVTTDKPVLLVGCQEDLVQQNYEPGDQVISSPTKALGTKAAGKAAGADGVEEEDALMSVADMESHLTNLIDQWNEVEVCLQCSAKKLSNVIEVFSHAQKAVMHPTGPLYDASTGQLKPQCVRALKRIFQMCDNDKDGFLSNKELNHFQTTCFNTPLQPEELEGVRKVVSSKIPDGIHDKGITLKGFVYLHALFVARGRMDTTWTVLRKFGYDNTLHLREDLVAGAIHSIGSMHPDQVTELSERGRAFLREVFHNFDKHKDGVLSDAELEELFSTAPETPGIEWQREIYARMVETSVPSSSASSAAAAADPQQALTQGCLTLGGFLSMWELTTMTSPKVTLTYMLYLGFKEDLSTTIQVSRRRKNEIKRGMRSNVLSQKAKADHSMLTRRTLNCFVFATRRQVQDSDTVLTKSTITADQQITVHGVEVHGVEKTLVLRQIVVDDKEASQANSSNGGDSQQGKGGIVLDPKLLQSCDLAVFAFGRERRELEEAVELTKQVERQGSGLLPCVLACISDTTDEGVMGSANAVAQQLEMAKPIESCGDHVKVLQRLCEIALNPLVSIPQTEERLAKEARDLMARRLTTGLVVSAGILSVGLIAMKLYMSTSEGKAAGDGDDNAKESI
ncbi:mitochondrial Rho GTPase [Chloropicon primus]|uniref:Mitochondrial Rho GTPase n=2 Tax=Chloropicon primus TaxID=1764295 RepID=A0A5B8N2Q2_9CHLO|nr:mitochondrial Rho GTPase [Chloropicon primus]|eukprot:QDZ25954.1 mitochondrial Rho GTPase [Chloropicon primus]